MDTYWRTRIKAIGAEGILEEEDLPSLDSQREKVRQLMLDGQWHSGPEILETAGGTEGMRRLRELRAKGYTVEKARDSLNRRFWWYRMTRVEQS